MLLSKTNYMFIIDTVNYYARTFIGYVFIYVILNCWELLFFVYAVVSYDLLSTR